MTELDEARQVAVIRLDILLAEAIAAIWTAESEEHVAALFKLIIGTRRALATLEA